MTDIVVHEDPLPPIVAAWLGTKSKSTQRNYCEGLGYFARFLGAGAPADALRGLVSGTRGAAVQTMESWKASMLHAGLSSSSVNVRMGAVRSAVDACRKFGLIEWDVRDVDMVKSEPRKDNRGVAWSDYETIVAKEPTTRGKALLRLLGDRGLRRAEVASIGIEHVTAAGVAVLRKGRRERETLVVNERTRAALAAWIAERGREPGPLFGLAPRGVYMFVQRSCRRAGFRGVHPHSFRHSFGTKVARESNGDAYLVKELLGHASITTSARYVDKDEERATAMLGTIGG